MKKRLAALLLVLALLLTCVPVGVVAEETDPEQLPGEGQEETAQAAVAEETVGETAIPREHDHKDDAHKCEHCNQFVTWQKWGDDEAEQTTLPTAGHYYLVAPIQVSAITDVKSSADLVLCLNGYTVDARHTTYIYRVGTNNSKTDKAKVTISDCGAYWDEAGVYHAGGLINGKGKDGGGAFFMRGASSLYMYAGKLTGHQNTQSSNSTGYGGGAITSRNTAAIYLENVEISGCSTGTEGGAIGSRDKVTITLKNVTIKNNTATRAGGAIYLDSADNKLTATDCIFENNTTAVTGGAVSVLSGEAVLTNCLLKKNTATTDGGAVYLTGENSELTATDCRFEENTSTRRGGAIAMLEGSSATVSGGAFHKNTGTTLGGAVYTNKSELTVQGTANAYLPLTENHGEAGSNGGAIYATGDGDVLLQHISMTGNTAATTGGSALMVTGGAQVTLADSSVTGNENRTTGDYRSAVYVAGAVSILTLSGKVEIRDNGNSDLYVQNNTYNRTNDDCWLVAEGMTEGTQVNLSTHTLVEEDENDYLNTRILDGQPASWKKGWIVYSGNQMAVDYNREEDKFFFTVNTSHLHCDCGDGTDAHCSHAQIPYMPWTDGDSLPASGAIYLETDVKLPQSVAVNGHLQICLNGHTISAEYAEQGDAKDRFFTLNNADRLTISDCTAKTENGVYTAGKLTGSSYTGVMVANSSTSDNTAVIDFYDGIFTDNESSAGAAFSIQDGATLNMYGGQISGNTSTNMGGAVYVGSNGTFCMYGGKITGNSAVNGTVYVTGSTLKLYGGTITGNTVTGLGGGVYLNKSPVTMGGTPVITGNTAGGNASNLYLVGTSQITFDGMGQGEQQIGIGADEAPRYLSTDMGEENPEKYFVADSQFRVLEVRDNRLYLNYTSDHGHCDCAGSDSHCDHQQVAWAPWESTTTLPSAEGYYYLLSDVTVSNHTTFSTGHVHLCLNGHTVTAAGAENTKSDRFYTLEKDAQLTITDCTAKTENGVYKAGKLTGATGTAIMIPNQTTDGAVNNVVVNLYEGIITGNTITGTGGVINVQDKAVFNMYGGEISGNTAKLAVAADGKATGGMGAAFYIGEAATLNIYAGAVTGNACEGSGTVYVTGGAALNMQGGKLSGNQAAQNAGGVMVTGNESAMTMQGGEISGNTAKSAGGVLVQIRGTLILNGGKITGNSATSQGGGVFISTNSTLVMTGGEVTGNNAAGNGGGIALYGAAADISGGKISGNTAANGGGLAARLGERTVDGEKFTDVPTVVNMTGGEVSGNKASSVGGGVFTHGEGTTFHMADGAISNNASPNGGGVITQTGSVFHLKGGKLNGNTAAKGGGGVYVSYTSVFHQSGGEIANNKADGNGGGIYALGSQLNLTGGKISGNDTKGSGAGIYANKYTRFAGKPNEITYTAQINLKGVAVENNTTPSNGAGICTSKGAVVNMSSGSVSGNVSAKAGAGMLLQSGSKLNLTGGTISNNRAKNGAGVYISSDSFINMTGGSISYNASTSNCAGLYLLKCEAVLGGGTISHNTSETIAGGIYVVGAQLKLCGTNITDNTAKTNGAGICTTKRTVGGVDYFTDITMTGGTISGNSTDGSGGGVLLQSKTTMTMSGGIVENNRTGKDGGGIYVSTNCTFHMNGGQILGNTAERNGGGLYNLKSTVNYNAGKITGNTAAGNGGGIVMSGEGYVGNMKKDMVITGNSSVNGGALVVQGRYTLNMEDVNLTDNMATTGNGGAIYLSTNSFLNIKGGTITNHNCDGYGGAIFSTTNSTLNMQGTVISDNKAGYGGAISLGGTATMEDLSVLGNEAVNEGGGIYCHKLKVGGLFEDHLITVKNTVLENNKAGTQGGGVYVLRGSKCLFDGLTVRENTAGGEGGGLYVVDDTAMYNMTVTGNTSDGGYALYLADSEYDGESYFIGIFKLGGVMVVKDNVGGDMYFGDQTAAAVDHMGLSEGTQMYITLHSGLLTQTLQGVYNYEGGDLQYIVTAGDRSVTDPEYDPQWNDRFNPTEPEEPAQGDEEPDATEKKTTSPLIWIMVGAGAVAAAVIAIICVVVAKKKKSAAGK